MSTPTQQDNALNALNAFVEYRSGGSAGSWVDLSDYSNKVSAAAGARQIGKDYVHGSDAPITKTGRKEESTVTIRALFTEQTGNPFNIIEDAFNDATQFDVRWAPAGSANGLPNRYTDGGYVSGLSYPEIDSSQPNPLMFEFTISAPSIERGTNGS